MEPGEWRSGRASSFVRDALVVSSVRFVRESLIEILGRMTGVRGCGQAATLYHALDFARSKRPAIVLLDVAFPGGIEAAMRIAAAAPEANLIALGVCETEEDVLAWAEAGIAGYVPDTASVSDLISLIEQIGRGEQTCPSYRGQPAAAHRRVPARHCARLAGADQTRTLDHAPGCRGAIEQRHRAAAQH